MLKKKLNDFDRAVLCGGMERRPSAASTNEPWVDAADLNEQSHHSEVISCYCCHDGRPAMMVASSRIRTSSEQ
jgi:hypothetical protein